jgi:hypothetical protein
MNGTHSTYEETQIACLIFWNLKGDHGKSVLILKINFSLSLNTRHEDILRNKSTNCAARLFGCCAVGLRNEATGAVIAYSK